MTARNEIGGCDPLRAATRPADTLPNIAAGLEPLRVLSMFSGIGALDLGLQRAGLEIAAQCEVDPYACRVLAERFPGVPNLGDVTKADFAGADANMIAAGFPCQDISNAGKRAGIAGSRSGLFREVMRAICVVRPRVVLLENVAALHDRDLGTVFGSLAEVGYDAFADCIPASHVGAPHDRDRTWIVAYPLGGEWREEPYRRALGRMGRVQQSVPWDRDWQSALREFRGMDDGTAYRVDRVDTIRNAVVAPLVEAIGRAILQAINNGGSNAPDVDCITAADPFASFHSEGDRA